MKTFGIISEGPTDQIIIENILVGFFNNDEISTAIRPLQPLRDATDADEIRKFGGWYKVFEYCSSQNFVDAFAQNDYLIIQIDTDRSEDEHYDVKKSNTNGDTLTPAELIAAVISKFELIFTGKFGAEQLEVFKERIIYAICVNEIECWILPLYFNNNTKSSTNNCIHKLNPKIKEELDFYIDPNNKSGCGREYEKMSKPYSKSKILMQKYSDNISLSIFIQNLQRKNIDLLAV